MKLTIEHLAPYLPYKLKMSYTSLDGKDARQWTLRDGTITEAIVNQNKPILRPLSDLTKPIIVEGYNDGKEFVPILELARLDNTHYSSEEMKRIYWQIYDAVGVPCYNVWYNTSGDEDDYIFSIVSDQLERCTYSVIQKLFKWHFEVDIPEGCWIDINTL